MPRKKRIQSVTGVYHWINRGVNQKKLFHHDDDFRHFLSLAKEHKDEFGIQIYHYCLMSNHIHMLLWSDRLDVLARFSGYIQRRYAYYYCKTYHWRGQVFQRMYKSLCIDKDSYLLDCARYIERNPIRAFLVNKPEDYLYSSFTFYAFGSLNDLLTPSPAYLGLSDFENERQELYREYVIQGRAYEELVDKALLEV
jgi:putative transposase